MLIPAILAIIGRQMDPVLVFAGPGLRILLENGGLVILSSDGDISSVVHAAGFSWSGPLVRSGESSEPGSAELLAFAHQQRFVGRGVLQRLWRTSQLQWSLGNQSGGTGAGAAVLLPTHINCDYVNLVGILKACAISLAIVFLTAGCTALGFYPRRSPMRCAACLYDLTGNVTGRCPECGNEISAYRMLIALSRTTATTPVLKLRRNSGECPSAARIPE